MMKTNLAPIKIAFLTLFAMLALTGCGGAAPASSSPQSLIERSDTIKSASVQMSDPDPRAVRNEVYASLDKFGAEVTNEHWADDHNVRYDGSMTIRLPSENFLKMVDWLKETFAVKTLDLSARVAGARDTGNSVVNGVAYSNIYLSFVKEMSFGDSFILSIGRAGDALRSSLETIVPVLAFLLPYGIAIWLFIELIRLIRRGIKRAVRKPQGQAPV